MRAVKVIKTTKDKAIEKQLISEVSILRTLDHPNIIKVHDFYQDK